MYLENIGLETLPPEELLLSHEVLTKDTLIYEIKEKLYQIKNTHISNYSENSNDQLINQLFNYIRNHYHEDISLDDISNAVHLHPNYVSSFFKKSTGQSYLTCLHKERIEAAKKLLFHTSTTIEEIAKQVGYNSSSQFARIFRKYENISPSDYRNKL